MPTRAQCLLAAAEKRIQEVATEPQRVREIYGGLCHSFPILVRTCGLCQALAFSVEKRTPAGGQPGPRHRAHQLLVEHVAKILEIDSQDPLAAVRGDGEHAVSTLDYMRHTRRVLESWVYFKRFAVSILDVPDARSAQDDRDEASARREGRHP